jgi:glutathione S-transferase
VASARDYFQHQVQHLERVLEQNGAYLIGSSFSAADLMLASCLAWARTIGIELSGALSEYLERMSARDAFREAISRNFTPAAMEMLRRTGSAAP